MKNKTASLADMVSSRKIDILAITETWLKRLTLFLAYLTLFPQDFLFYVSLDLMEEGVK